MLPMLVVKRKMSTIKQLGKGDNVHQSPLAYHNSLKIIVQKMLLKTFLTSICIMTN
jgi:hypothetical protein